MSALNLENEKAVTVDDICNLPDGQRAELIDGTVYDMASPSWKHQRLITFLTFEIENHIRNNDGKCEVLPAPFAVFLNNDKDYLEPDISVICDPSRLDDEGCHGAPDWVVEIVSPSTSSRDYMVKLFKYKNTGVREYWIVDPSSKVITVYNFENDNVRQYKFGDDVPAGIYEGFYIKIPADI